jgi:hypothetical protein
VEKTPQITSQDFTSRQIGHLGLVAGMIDELGISAVIDEALPKTRDHKVVTACSFTGFVSTNADSTSSPGFSPIYRRNNY